MRKRIVIVEGDQGIQEVLKLVLEEDGYEIVISEGGSHIRKEGWIHPDGYLIDIGLSDKEGLDLCRYLKTTAVTRHIPIAILSAAGELQSLATDAGADVYLEKPFELDDLQEMVHRLVSG